MADKIPLVTTDGLIEQVKATDTVKIPGAFTLASMNQPQINALTPANGSQVYNTTVNQSQVYENSSWVHKGNTIISSTYLYIDTAGDDVNGNGSVSYPWLTVDKALDFLSKYTLLANVFILIEKGDYSDVTDPLTINHPNGDKINIEGDSYLDTVVFSSVSGASGNYSYILTTTHTSQYTVNDYVLVYGSDATASNEIRAYGTLKVTAINPGVSITLHTINTSAASGGTFYISIPQVRWARLLSITSPLAMVKGIQNVYSLAAHLDLIKVEQKVLGLVTIEDCLFVNVGTARYGYCKNLCGTSVYLRRTGTRNTNAGWYCYQNASATIEDSGFTDCKYAIYIYTGSAAVLYSSTGISASIPHFIHNQYGVYALMESIVAKDGNAPVFSNNTTDSSPAASSEGNYNSYVYL